MIRAYAVLLMIALGFGLLMGGEASAQTPCTGLCQQQTACAGNATTSITGAVYAPNGSDPLPNVMVYIPNAPVGPFTPGVSCPLAGAPPSGSPLIGTITAVDGSFTLTNVPSGANIPLVIVSGRWRRQLVIPNITACTNTPLSKTFAVMPRNQTQGDIPKIAIATGSADAVECVLRKVGIDDSEFTDPTGTGRINIYGGGASGTGVTIDSATPTQASLMGTLSTLEAYDVLMLPCEGSNFLKPAQELANLVSFANDGGRIYASHYSYSWTWQNYPFNTVANWIGDGASPSPDPGVATVNTSFTEGQTLAQWLQLVGASTTYGQMAISTLRKNISGVVAPTQSWLTLNNTAAGNPDMQFVFDTPVLPAGSTGNQCGRVLFNEYHVENPGGTGSTFPLECASGAMTAQEKLLEFSLFGLTDDGGQPSLSPISQDFGSEAVGYPTAAKTFTWTNNSSFPLGVSAVGITGIDFNIASDNCTSATVVGGGSCTITVVFKPTTLGPLTGTLSVVSAGFSQTASLSGTGVPGFSLATNTLNFGDVVVSDSKTLTLTLTSNASGPQAFPTTIITGDYSINTSGCGAMVAAGASCTVAVTFLPTALGTRAGTLTVNSTGGVLTATLIGNGIPGFTLSPTTLSFGNLDVGASASQSLTLTSVAQRALVVPVFIVTGQYAVSTAACGATVAAHTSCLVTVTFLPTVTGPLSGTIAGNSADPAYAGLNATMSGNGVDFTIALNPTSGTVIAGDGTSTTATLTPIAGFASTLTLSCVVSSAATASSCTLNPMTVVPTSVVTAGITLGTTSQYTVIGYGGFGGGWTWLVALGSGWLLWPKRRRAGGLLRGGLLVLLLGAMGMSLTGCSGKIPDQHSAWTGAGSYAITVTATDGFLVHSATYNLTVTAK